MIRQAHRSRTVVQESVKTDANRRLRTARVRNNGLTLFELLLALAIFLASLAALAQLLASGSRAASQAKLQTEAMLRCESKLGELVAGIEPLDAASQGAFVDDPRWKWEATVAPGPWPTLQFVELRVSRAGQSSLSSTSFVLQRYVRDPRLFVKPVRQRTSSLSLPRGGRSSIPPSSQPTGSAEDAEAEDAD